MKLEKEKKALIIFGLFFVVALGFMVYTVYESWHFRDGVSVQGQIVDVDLVGASKHRRYYATVVVNFDNTEISKRFNVPRTGVSIGGINVRSSLIKEGDQIEMLVVPSTDGYDIAMADSVRNPWPKLAFGFSILIMVSFLFWFVATKQKGFKIGKRLD